MHGRVSTAFIYDDNISLHDNPRSGTRVGGINTGRDQEPLGDDFIFTISPGVIVTKAEALDESRTAFTLDYAPAFHFFLKNSGENSIDHNARMNAGYAFTKLTLGLVQSFAITEGGVVDVGDRVGQKTYQTGASARYEMTEKTFLALDGSIRITDYDSLTDSDEWSVTPTANYQITPKTALGLGVTYGQLTVAETRLRRGTTNQFETVNETQPYVGPTFRAAYRTTEKTDVSLSFGGEYRMYSDGSSSFGPVFSLSGSYRPREGTSFTIEGHRREQNSAVISGANYVATGGSIGARQRLRDRLFGTLTFSYDHSDYEPVSRGVSVDRQDDYFLLRSGLEAILGRSWTIGLFYQYREDVSSDDSYSFNNNQVGIQATWGY